MLQVTGRAVVFLREVQEDPEKPAGMTFRLVERHSDFGLAFDAPSGDDQVFKSEGRDVLCVSPDLEEVASDVIIDVEETSEGRRLTFLVGGG